MKKSLAIISTILMLCVYATNAQTALRATADSLFNAKDWKAAATAFDAINVAYPNPSVGITFFRAAYAYHQLNDYTKSIVNYRRTLEIVPTNTTAMYNIAAAFSKTQQRDSALYWLKTLAKTGYSQYKTLETDPDFTDWQQTWVDDSGQLTEYINGFWIEKEICFPFRANATFQNS